MAGKKKNFKELSDVDSRLTNITWNGEMYEYPRKPPVVPVKSISREPDGKFRTCREENSNDLV